MCRRWSILLILGFLLGLTARTQHLYSGADSSLLREILSDSPFLSEVAGHADEFRLQILYTRIVHHNDTSTSLVTHTFRYRPGEYFNPASTVKLPLALFTLEKLNSLNKKGITKDTRLKIGAGHSCQEAVTIDPTARDSVPTLDSYMKKALIVSNNDAYNRLYEFLGQQTINQRFRELGYRDARVLIRFNRCNTEENRYTNSFTFFSNAGKKLHYQPPSFNATTYRPPLKNMKVGDACMEGGKLLHHPKDFSEKNCLPLDVTHDLLQKIMYPENFNTKLRLTKQDRQYLKEVLACLPSQSDLASIRSDSTYYEAMTNYLYYGSDTAAIIRPDLKIMNIVGQAYGFLVDAAYFHDACNRVEFFLSCVIYVNKDGIVGDGVYELDQVGLPFLRELGKVIYEYEKNHSLH